MGKMKMVRWSVVSILFILTIGSAWPLTLSLPVISGNPGDVIEIEVGVDEAQGIESYRIVIDLPNLSNDYPLEYIKQSATGKGTLTKDWGPPVETDLSQSSQQGFVVLLNTAGDLPPLKKGRGVLVRFKVRIKKTARNGRIDLNFKPGLSKINGETGTFKTERGSIRVDATFLWGDINKDSVPDSQDAYQILQYDALLRNTFEGHHATRYRWPDQFPPEADVNGDQTLGAYDAWHIVQYEIFELLWFPADVDQNGVGPDEQKVEVEPESATTVRLPNLQGHPGDVLDVAVQIQEASNVASYRIALDFPNVSPSFPLEYVVGSATTAGTLTENWPIIMVNDQSRTEGTLLFVSVAGMNPPLPEGPGILFQFQVRIKDTKERGTYSLDFPAQSKTQWRSRLNDGLIPANLKTGSIEIREFPYCGFEFSVSGFPIVKTLENDSPLMFPKHTGPLFSEEGDMIAAAADVNQSTPFTRLIYSPSEGGEQEIGRFTEMSGEKEILSLVYGGRNIACLELGDPTLPERCYVFFRVPFQITGIGDAFVY